MPYIKREDRDRINLGYSDWPRTSGELNYAITMLIKNYYKDNGMRYQQINDVLGALEGAKLEFYDRVARPYEDEKIRERIMEEGHEGDVYSNTFEDESNVHGLPLAWGGVMTKVDR